MPAPDVGLTVQAWKQGAARGSDLTQGHLTRGGDVMGPVLQVRSGQPSELCPLGFLQQDGVAGGPGGGPVHAGHSHLHSEVSLSYSPRGQPWDRRGDTPC